MRVLEALARRGRTFEIRHCTNSGALARYPEMYLDMVRPGIALYGAGADRDRLGLRLGQEWYEDFLLDELAVNDKAAFTQLTETAKKALA